jgi:hypothetical protein
MEIRLAKDLEYGNIIVYGDLLLHVSQPYRKGGRNISHYLWDQDGIIEANEIIDHKSGKFSKPFLESLINIDGLVMYTSTTHYIYEKYPVVVLENIKE